MTHPTSPRSAIRLKKTCCRKLLQANPSIKYQPDALTAIDALVGIAVERLAVGAMDSNDPNVQSQDAALAQQRQAWRDLSKQGEKVLTTLSDEEAAVYFERLKMFGAQSALQWLVNKYGQPESNLAPAR